MVDVGHGTGIWTYEQAEWTPWADVVGIDLHSRTPERIDEMGPVVNASFITPVNFLHSDWPFTPGSVDLIRMSRLCGSVPSWLEQYQTLTRCVCGESTFSALLPLTECKVPPARRWVRRAH